jgi:ATP-binding cassette subfamily B protein/ATP-binding cassette subfamily C protein
VVLDEASSRLDPLTEERIAAATDALLAGRTALVIAHRLDTLDRVDEVAVLDRGRLVEHGRRDELATTPGSRYARLRRAARAADRPDPHHLAPGEAPALAGDRLLDRELSDGALIDRELSDGELVDGELAGEATA